MILSEDKRIRKAQLQLIEDRRNKSIEVQTTKAEMIVMDTVYNLVNDKVKDIDFIYKFEYESIEKLLKQSIYKLVQRNNFKIDYSNIEIECHITDLRNVEDSLNISIRESGNTHYTTIIIEDCKEDLYVKLEDKLREIELLSNSIKKSETSQETKHQIFNNMIYTINIVFFVIQLIRLLGRY